MATLVLDPRRLRSPLVLGGGAAIAAGLIAALLANLGSKSLVVVAAGAVVVGGMLAVRDRALWILFLAVAGFQFMLHKSFGPIDTTISSGAPALYVTSLDVFVLFLYLLWWWEGGLARDVGAALGREKLLWLPLLPVAGSLLSLFAAPNLNDAFAELLRMFWMFGLFLYLALRVRGRQELLAVVVGLFLIAIIQCGIVILQWRGHANLGLSFLGEDAGTYIRTLNQGVLQRPAGTEIHPDIMAALVAPIGLLGLALALNLKDLRWRLLSLLGAVAAFFPLGISETRGAIVAAVVAGLLLVGLALASRRVGWLPVLAPVPFLGLALWYFWPKVQQFISNNLQGSQFHLEIQARLQLNGVALTMAQDNPIAGAGLNNFMAVFNRYAPPEPIIYPGYPAHDLYLIVLGETGALGLLALVVVLVTILVVSIQVARSQDRLIAALGLGGVAMIVFYGLEELLSFSLRNDAPLALFWIVAALVVAARRFATPPRQAVTPEVGADAS